MIPPHENCRNCQALEYRWTRKLRILQKSGREAFIVRRLIFAKHTGEQTDNSINNDRSRQLPSGNDKVACRDFVRNIEGAEPVVKSLVSPAHQNHSIRARQVLEQRLVQSPARRREQYHSRRRSIVCAWRQAALEGG